MWDVFKNITFEDKRRFTDEHQARKFDAWHSKCSGIQVHFINDKRFQQKVVTSVEEKTCTTNLIFKIIAAFNDKR